MLIKQGVSTGTEGNVRYRLSKLGPVGGHWLDCGGFDGHYAAGLLQRGAEHVTITDVGPERVDEARRLHGQDTRLSFAVCPAERMPFDTGSFDGVLLNEVLEHVADDQQAAHEIARVLKPGGRLFLFSPNRWFPIEGHGLHVGERMINVPAPLIPWLPKRLTGPFVKARNYWPHELVAICRNADLRIERRDFALPLFEHYPWLPERLVAWYLRHLDRLDRSPLRRFGVSTLVVARKP